MSRRERLDQLTQRWHERHERRADERRASGSVREPADPERAAVAAAAFPFRELPAAEYVTRHGDQMTAFTYDDYTYPDPELQAWIDEVGRLLRQRRQTDR